MRLYVASSWRNKRYGHILSELRSAGFDCYDFKDPSGAFQWSAIDPAWMEWDACGYRAALDHPEALRGFARDSEALANADACVLVLPCGRSAHLEAGWAAGAGKPLFILIDDGCEPELMYKFARLVTADLGELLMELRRVAP